MAAEDLLVVGFDLVAGREVHIEDRPMDQWRTLGYRHGESLVCAACFRGLDGTVPGTRVPLIARGRVGGARRHHFAHPPHMAPPGGHHPETLWHLEAKTQLERWARSLPGVDHVRQEQWIPGRERRTDVHVRLTDGSQIALEAQSSLITDQLWRRRHRDYAAAGIRDIWFMRPGAALPHVLLTEQTPVCVLDLADRAVRLIWGQPHPRSGRWWEGENPAVHALHHPPCPGDDLHEETVRMAELGLHADGLLLPERLTRRLAEERRRARREADDRRLAEQAHSRGLAAQRPARLDTVPPASRRSATPGPCPTVMPRASKPRCAVCGGRLADVLAPYGAHISVRTAHGWVDCLDQPCAPQRLQPTPAAPWPHAA